MVGASMVRNPIDIWFDFIDPASVLLMLEIEAATTEGMPWTKESEIRWLPLELRPPGTPLVGIDASEIAPLWESARPIAAEAGVELAPPALVPWTRKAHELIAHGAEQDPSTATILRLAVARAYALQGQDIGRVDVLVQIGIEHGLDRTETKAVLDVDRYEGAVSAMMSAAAGAQMTRTPTIVTGSQRFEGFHNRIALGTLLGT
jgi:predicted DsbA family dithiol-disulfide isomerase